MAGQHTHTYTHPDPYSTVAEAVTSWGTSQHFPGSQGDQKQATHQRARADVAAFLPSNISAETSPIVKAPVFQVE